VGFLDPILSYRFETVDIALFLTLVALEAVLSFDNAAVLAAMVRKLPVHDRRRALLYGLGGAYVFRAAAILGAYFIIQNPWLKVVGGAYLLYLAAKHFVERSPGGEEEAPAISKKRFFGLTAFWSLVIAVELMDIAFALDQVLVAVAMTPKVVLIILASFTAIVFLRISAFYVTKLMDWFPPLESLAYVAVGFVGLKLIVTEIMHYASACGPAYFCHEGKFEVPKEISIGITMTVIVLPVAVKAILDRTRRARTRSE
jgi:YkoY family integral membrane protein